MKKKRDKLNKEAKIRRLKTDKEGKSKARQINFKTEPIDKEKRQEELETL